MEIYSIKIDYFSKTAKTENIKDSIIVNINYLISDDMVLLLNHDCVCANFEYVVQNNGNDDKTLFVNEMKMVTIGKKKLKKVKKMMMEKYNEIKSDKTDIKISSIKLIKQDVYKMEIILFNIFIGINDKDTGIIASYTKKYL